VLEKCPSAIVSSSYWHVTGGDPTFFFPSSIFSLQKITT